MALGNFIKEGSYTNIQSINEYSKKNKNIVFTMTVFDDNTKQSICATLIPNIISDPIVFDRHFSIENLSLVDNNIYKAIYNYLKTKPEFANCTDV